MSLGIITRYHNHEATHIAIRLCDWALSNGYDSSIYPITRQKVRVDDRWDAIAAKHRGKRFTDWAKKRTTIIWTHIPPAAQVTWAKKQQIRTVLFGLWQEITPEDRVVINEMDRVIAPHTANAQFYTRRLGVKRVHTAPWDTGLPFTAKDPRTRTSQRWLLMPLYDQEPDKTEMTAIEVAGRTLHNYDHTVLTVMYNSSTLGSPSKRRLNRFKQLFTNRVRLLPSVPVCRRPLVFQQHDLTLWPTQRENTGMVGLTSITMGTPIIAFSSSPLNEIITERNGIPIPAREVVKPSGVPRTDGDFDAFERSLSVALSRDDYLSELQQSVLDGLPARREQFNRTIANAYTD